MDGNVDSTTNGARTGREMLLYKFDRTLAIVGLVIIGAVALYFKQTEIAMVCASGLGVYAGVKGGK